MSVGSRLGGLQELFVVVVVEVEDEVEEGISVLAVGWISDGPAGIAVFNGIVAFDGATGIVVFVAFDVVVESDVVAALLSTNRPLTSSQFFCKSELFEKVEFSAFKFSP